MATIKVAYGDATSLAITLANLANAAARASDAVVNTAALFWDAHLYVAVTLAAGSPAGYVNVWAYTSVDGTNYTGPATGSDAGVTMPTTDNSLALIGRIYCGTGGALMKATFQSLAEKLGGVLPAKWGIILENSSGVALAATGHAVTYRGVYVTSS